MELTMKKTITADELADILHAAQGRDFNLYIEDTNTRVHVTSYEIRFTDLTYAMKTGKRCHVWGLHGRNMPLICAIVENGINRPKDIGELVYKVYTGDVDAADNLDYLYSFDDEPKSIDTFNPLAKYKKQTINEKTTGAAVVKAILAGQIKGVKYAYRYTDDYRYDAAANFMKDVEVDLMDFAEEVWNDRSGWHVYFTSNGDIDFSKYGFEAYTLEIA